MPLPDANGSDIGSYSAADSYAQLSTSPENSSVYSLNYLQPDAGNTLLSEQPFLLVDVPNTYPSQDEQFLELPNSVFTQAFVTDGSAGLTLLEDEDTSSIDVLTGQSELVVGSEDLITSSGATKEIINPLEVANYAPYVPGVFTVGESGEVTLDFLFDGGGYSHGQLAIFSLEGMETLIAGSKEFNREAAFRALSDSALGHIVISDAREGARFSGILGKSDNTDFNSGEYLGQKAFQMQSGSLFAVMLVPNGEIQSVFENPAIEGAIKPLYSIAEANPDGSIHIGQMLDVFGDGTTFAMEDLRTDTGSDRDANDLIFKFGGAVGYAPLLSDFIDSSNDWRYSSLGQEIFAYVSTNDNPEKVTPGDPVRDPILPGPQVPISTVDQGNNSLAQPTPIVVSPIQDIIDQVSSSDVIDIYQVRIDQLLDAKVTVLTGTITVSILDSSGTLLSSQTLTKGSHSLLLPDGTPNNVLIKVDQVDNVTATYVLTGFESQAKEPFNIDLEFGEEITASQQSVINAAAQSIEGLIQQGLPSAIVDGKIIDDLNVKLGLRNLDGAGGTLAQTKIDYMRYGTLLPAQSIVQFDKEDFAELERSGSLFNVVQHELLHALGFGNLWEAKGLVEYAKTPFSQYIGKNALAAFAAAGGTTSFIPLETGGEGSADLHWNENLFQDEIMTRDLNAQGGDALISSVTLSSLKDLGYAVNAEAISSNWSLFPTAPQDLVSGFSEKDKILLAQLVTKAETQARSGIPTVVPAVDANEIAPTIWANAERFDKNGEYYDWELVTIPPNYWISKFVRDRMANHPSSDNRSPQEKIEDLDYWNFISRRNGFPDNNWIVAGDPAWVPVWRPNYEQEQEAERKRREEELRQKEEEEKKQQDKLKEAYRQNGQGGLEWFLAKPLRDFSTSAPYETSIQDLVGNLVPDDYFRFTLSRNGRVTLYLEDLLADADLYLYDSRNREIGRSARSGLTDEKLILDLAAGTYLARVHSPGGVTTDYNLKVQFQGQLTRSQMGPPVGWVPGVGIPGGSGRPRPTFSDPRIERIFTTARDKFSNEQWAQAQPQINSLEAQKQQKQRELDQLLAEAIAQQKAKIYAALDNVRTDLTGRISGVADGIKHNIYWAAEGGINAVNGLVPGWLQDKLDWLGLGDGVRSAQETLRSSLRGARDWLNSQVDWVRNEINGAISQFIEMVKNAYLTGAEINAAIDGAANWLRSKTDSLVNFLNGKIGEFKGWVLGKLEWARNVRIPDWAKRLGVPDWNLYDHAIVGLVDGATRGVQGAIGGAGNLFKGVLDIATPLMQGAVAYIVDKLIGDKTGNLYNEINGINQKIANIRNNIVEAISTQTDLYKQLLQQFLDGLGEAKDFVVGAIFGGFNNEASLWQILFDAAIPTIIGIGVDLVAPGAGRATEIGLSIAQGIRDLVAELFKVLPKAYRGESLTAGDWLGLGAAAVGAALAAIPLAGPYLRSLSRIAGLGSKGASMLTDLRKLGGPVIETILNALKNSVDWSAIGKRSGDLLEMVLDKGRELLAVLGSAMQLFDQVVLGRMNLAYADVGAAGLQHQSIVTQLDDTLSTIRIPAREETAKAASQIEDVLDGAADDILIGAGKALSGSPPFSEDIIKSFLRATEGEVTPPNPNASHVFRDHIATGDSVDDFDNLMNQLARKPNAPQVTMFRNEDVAAQALAEFLNDPGNYSAIENFAKSAPAGQNMQPAFSFQSSINDLGFGIDRDGNTISQPMSKIRVVVQSRGDGTWKVQSVFPF